MKVIEFKLDRKSNVASIKYKFTDSEVDIFDVGRRRTIKDIVNDLAKSYDADTVIRATFRALDFPIEMYDHITDAKEAGRARKLVDVRSACMFQLRKHTDLSLQAIGKMFGLHHATVIHNIKRFQDQLDLKDEALDLIDREVEYILAEVLSD